MSLADYQLQESPNWGANGMGNTDAYEAITECIRVIEQAPTIDPVKHGKWYITEDMPYFGHIQDYLTCSACKGRFHGTGVEEWDYCPNCGARMDGE